MAVPIGEYKQAVAALAQRMKAFYDRARIDIEKEWEKNYIPGSRFANEVEALAQENNQEIDDKFIERFCHKAVMTLMLKFIFLRFAEDKKILKSYFRSEAIEKWQAENKEVQEVIREAFEKAKEKFKGLYKITVYDEFLPTKQSLEIYLIDALSDEPRSGLYKDKGSLDFATLDPIVVSAFYEKLFDRKKRKELGLFFTPPVIAEYLVEKAFEGQKITNDFLVLDPACGSGQILLAAYKKLKDIFVNQLKMSSAEAHKEILSHNLWGIDVEPFAVLLSKINLALQDLENIPEYINIIHGDSLLETSFDIPQMAMLQDIGETQKQKLVQETVKLQGDKAITVWRNGSGRILLEKPIEQKQLFELAERMKTGIFSEDSGIRTMQDLPKEFDAIIANPPYVRQEKILTSYKDKLAPRFEVYSGRADLYIFFIETGIKKLSTEGKLSFISSNKWIKAGYGVKLREYVKSNVVIEELINLSRSEVFQDATVDPLIFVFRNTKTRKRATVKVCDVVVKDMKELSTFVDENKFLVDYRFFNKGPWLLVEKDLLAIKEKLDKKGRMLNEFIQPLVGIKTGLNKVFIVSENLKKQLIKKSPNEEILYKPVIFGKEIHRYGIKWQRQYLIFPYDGDLNILNIKDFPNTFRYLYKYKNELSARAIINKGKLKWFELQQINKNIHFEKVIIVFPDISTKPRFCISKDFWVDMTAFILNTSDKFILTVLNSKLCDFYIKLIASQLGETGSRYKAQYISQFPVCFVTPSSNKKPFTRMAEKMLTLNKKLQEIENSFYFYGFVEEKIENKISLREINGSAFVNIKDSRAKLGDKGKINAKQQSNAVMVAINKKPVVKIVCQDEVSAKFLTKYLNGVRTSILAGEDGSSWIERILNTKIHWDKKAVLEKILNEYESLFSSAGQIKKEIAETDKKIDEMVYDLYGITKEEREIIEESIR